MYDYQYPQYPALYNMAAFKENFGKKKTLKSKLKGIFSEWAENTTSHGIPSIYRTRSIILRIMWFILFLASVGGCIAIIVVYLIQFFEYDVTVNVDIITESPALFPAVTICNLNPYYYPRAKPFIEETLNTKNISSLAEQTVLNQDYTASDLVSRYLGMLKAAAFNGNKISESQRRLLGYSIDDMFISCKFNGATCSPANFTYLKSYDFTNCYTFNHDPANTLTASGTGYDSGLQLELFVGDADNTEALIDKRGIYVVVHNQTVTPIFDSEGLQIPVSSQSNIGVKKVFRNTLSSPYSNCLDNTNSPSSYDSLLYKAIFNKLNETQYRQIFCLKLCYQMAVIKKCVCNDPSVALPVTTYNNVTIGPCRSTTESRCMDEIRIEFESTSIISLCYDDCPKECNSVSYVTSYSAASYPSVFYLNWLKLQTNVQMKFPNNKTSNLKDSILKLNVFFEDSTYTIYSDSASESVGDLLGNIGGQCGLFIGISILSVVEFFELIYLIILACIRYR